jgi:hypothetical protein
MKLPFYLVDVIHTINVLCCVIQPIFHSKERNMSASNAAAKRKFQTDLLAVMNEVELCSQNQNLNNQTVITEVKSMEVSKNQNCPITQICVMVRGEISARIFKAWDENFPKKMKMAHFTMSTTYKKGCSHIVVTSSCSSEVLLAWMKCGDLPTSTYLVLPEWIVESLKGGKLLDFTKYLHPLFSSGSSHSTDTNNATVSNVNENTTHSIMTSQPSSSGNISSSATHSAQVKQSYLERVALNSNNSIVPTQHYITGSSSNSINLNSSTQYHPSTPPNITTSATQYTPLTPLTPTQPNYTSQLTPPTSVDTQDGNAISTRPPKLTKQEWMKKHFACATTGTTSSSNANKHITDILEELQSIYELSGL